MVMEAFTFDRSGVVAMPQMLTKGFSRSNVIAWSDLSPFPQGYIEGLFASLPVDVRGQWLDTVDPFRSPGFSDLAPETLARIIADCSHFENVAAGLGAKTGAAEGRHFYNARRNGFPGVWRELWGTAYPPLTPYLGDDGRVYLRETSPTQSSPRRS